MIKHTLFFYQLPTFTNKAHSICDSYQQAKNHKLPFYLSPSLSCNVLNLIFQTSGVLLWFLHFKIFRYYEVFVDDFSKFIWFYPLVWKYDAEHVFYKFQVLVEWQFGSQIKMLQTYWGEEYCRLNTYPNFVGISHWLICPYTHKQNKFVERKWNALEQMWKKQLSTYVKTRKKFE